MKKRGIEVCVFRDEKSAINYAATLIASEIRKKPSLVLGLATGETMTPLYKKLVSLYKNKKVDFGNARTFNLDELINVEKKKSLRHFMDVAFFNHVDIKKSNINFLEPKKTGMEKICRDYEKKIVETGGIDLQILGIGLNGHIGFNESGSSVKSVTRKVTLTEKTRKALKKKFDVAPKFALTVGVETILSTKKILLLAFGSKKSKILYETLSNLPSTRIPASFLQKHNNVKFIVNLRAASKMSDKLIVDKT
jgi:glucosamine-6-phosphate deaminase